MATELSFKDSINFLGQLHDAMHELIFFYEHAVTASGLAGEETLVEKLKHFKELKDELLLVKQDFDEFSANVTIVEDIKLEH